jgi:hypothetical protein
MKKKIAKTIRGRARPGRRSLAQVIRERGSVAQFARDLSKLSGEPVTWARVNNWIIRGSVSKTMAVYVHKLTGAPLAELLRFDPRL